MEMPLGQWRVVVVDPPWDIGATHRKRGDKTCWSPLPYRLLSVADIRNMPYADDLGCRHVGAALGAEQNAPDSDGHHGRVGS